MRILGVIRAVVRAAGIIWAVAVCALLLPTTVHAAAELEGESAVLGYLLSHEQTLRHIEKTWPDLGASAATARAEFQASFGAAHDNLVEALVAAFGKAEADKRVAAIARESEAAVPADLTRDQAVAFIQEVRDEAAGEIGVDKILLAYAYLDAPEKEFTDGWRTPYSVKGHPKAGPLDIEIKVPGSWIQEESNGSRIVQSFFASTTPGRINFMIMIHDMTKENVAIAALPRDHVFKVKQSSMPEMIPDGATMVESEVTEWLGRPAGIMVYDLMKAERRERPLMRTRSIFTYRQKHLIMLSAMVFAADQAELEAEWPRFEPLFKLVGDSLVYNAQP